MVLPLVPILWIAGIAATGYALKQANSTTRELGNLSGIALVGGATYVTYKIAKAKGLIK